MKIKFISAFKNLVVTLSPIVFIIQIFIFQSCNGRNTGEQLTIGQNGNLREIIIPAKANEVVKFAASELQYYFKKITGEELPIKISDEKLNEHKSLRFIIEDNKAIKWDGFSIEVTRKDIVLSAS